MNPESDENLKIIKRIVTDTFQEKSIEIERIVLFGSRARGDFQPDSDYDMLVLIQNPILKADKVALSDSIRSRCADYFIGNHIAYGGLDIIIKQSSDYNEEENCINTLSNTVHYEGRVLYK